MNKMHTGSKCRRNQCVRAVSLLLLIATLLVCFGCPVCEVSFEYVAPARFETKNDGWGVINTKGEIITEPQYLMAQKYSNGLAAVCTKEGWGYINDKGKEVIPCQFSYAEDYASGFAPVYTHSLIYKDPIDAYMYTNPWVYRTYIGDLSKGSWKYISASGLPLKSPSGKEHTFKYANSFCNDLADAQTKWERIRIRPTGEILHTPDFWESNCLIDADETQWEQIYTDEKTGQMGFVGIPGLFDNVKQFSNGLAAVSRDEEWGFIDKTGKLVIDCKFSEPAYFGKKYAYQGGHRGGCFIDREGNEAITPFSFSGHPKYGCVYSTRVVELEDGTKKTYKGIFTFLGEELIPAKYESVTTLSPTIQYSEKGNYYLRTRISLIVAKIGDRSDLYDFRGNLLLSTTLGDIYSYLDTHCVIKANDDRALVSLDGKVVIPLGDHKITMHEGVILVEDDKGIRLYDGKGTPLSDTHYKDNHNRGGYITLDTDGKTTICFTDTLTIIDRCFDEIGRVSENCFAFRDGNFWGYCDKKGNILLPPTYEEAFEFSSGLARVKNEGLYGYINEQFKEVIPCVYENALNCTENKCVVKVCGKGAWGFINEKGVEVSKRYDYASLFSAGLAVVSQNGKWGYVNSSLKEVIPLKFERAGRFASGLAPVKMNGKWGYINTNGQFIHEPQFEYAREFLLGTAMLSYKGKRIFITSSGEEATEEEIAPRMGTHNKRSRFYSRFTFNNLGELGWIEKDLLFTERSGQFRYYIDEISSEIIDCSRTILTHYDGTPVDNTGYEGICELNTGNFEVEENGKQGVIDKDGNVIIPLEYRYINHQGGDTYVVTNEFSKQNLVNGEGDILLETWFDRIQSYGYYAKVTRAGKDGLINQKGEEIIPTTMDAIYKEEGDFWYVEVEGEAWIFNIETGDKYPIEVGITTVAEDGTHRFKGEKGEGLKDLDGNILLEANYFSLYSIRPGIWKVSQGSNENERKYYFFINTKALFDASEYDMVSDDLLKHKKKGKYALIDSSLNQITEYVYDDIWDFSEDQAIAVINSKLGVINRKGEFVIKPVFDGLHNQYEGVHLAKINKKWGLIDAKAQFIIEPCFDSVSWFNQGVAFVQLDNLWGAISSSGAWILKPFSHEQGRIWDGHILFGNPEHTFDYKVFDKTGVECTDKYNEPKRKIVRACALNTGEDDSKENPRWVFIRDLNGKMIPMAEHTPVINDIGGRFYIFANTSYESKVYNGLTYLDENCQFLTEPQYLYLRPFTNGLGVAYKNSHWGALNDKGEPVVPFTFNWLGSYVKKGE